MVVRQDAINAQFVMSQGRVSSMLICRIIALYPIQDKKCIHQYWISAISQAWRPASVNWLSSWSAISSCSDCLYASSLRSSSSACVLELSGFSSPIRNSLSCARPADFKSWPEFWAKRRESLNPLESQVFQGKTKLGIVQKQSNCTVWSSGKWLKGKSFWKWTEYWRISLPCTAEGASALVVPLELSACSRYFASLSADLAGGLAWFSAGNSCTK